MMDAARRRLPLLDRGGQGSECQTRIDGAADGIANNEPGPGVQNDGDINEAAQDGDVGYIGDPKLVGSIKRYGFGKVGKDWLVVVAIRRFRKAAPHSGL